MDEISGRAIAIFIIVDIVTDLLLLVAVHFLPV